MLLKNGVEESWFFEKRGMNRKGGFTYAKCVFFSYDYNFWRYLIWQRQV